MIGKSRSPKMRRKETPSVSGQRLREAQNCRCSPFCFRFGWLGPVGGLGSTHTMDNLAPAMVVVRGCIHRLDYMDPHPGPG
ncbi:unnamed protein product [Echinostoma caproni]|uniref:Uncharacterized protein n=1 Tax=Echinostoma caproni TaxID=27848 RepID=A0A183AY78_9TREM|nr:unnamed protein product [Echinostoma caproni]